jgi:hypothetical protein
MTTDKIYTIKELNEIKDKAKLPCCGTIDSNHIDGNCILGYIEFYTNFYPHGGGVFVEGLDGKQWVYFTCKRCHYKWALWKILGRLKEDYETQSR